MVLKYAAIHLTELAVVVLVLLLVRHFLGIPAWLVVAVVAVAIAKDLAFFPKVWKAYAAVDQPPLAELVGQEATVLYALDPVGYVMVRGELWKAVSVQAGALTGPLRPGERVRVRASRGMTLVVERTPGPPWATGGEAGVLIAAGGQEDGASGGVVATSGR